jgi:uncharacterized membrane protein
MASLVEFVEALTIVLAVGVTRGWRSALMGTAAGLIVLVALVLALGRSLSAVPLPLLQLVVGFLLLMFGLRWLHKAVLRAAGVVPVHDQNQAFTREIEAHRGAGDAARAALDKIALVTSFKTVMLEGIEVVFIVIALGASGGHLVPASVGALLALLLVVGLGLWLHRPLANVPENSLKFGVGVMLSAFGTFWVGEGIGLVWPGADAAILVLIAVFLTVARVCKRLYVAEPVKPAPRAAQTATAALTSSGLTWIGSELLGLFVGDLWLAAGVVVWVIGAWAVEARYGIAAGVACSLFAAGLAAVLAVSAVRQARLEGGRWR